MASASNEDLFEKIGFGKNPEGAYKYFSGEEANKEWTPEELSYYTA